MPSHDDWFDVEEDSMDREPLRQFEFFNTLCIAITAVIVTDYYCRPVEAQLNWIGKLVLLSVALYSLYKSSTSTRHRRLQACENGTHSGKSSYGTGM
jgi:hypothetical protein